MPYASEKQRRYMESQEPEVAARWRASGHAYVTGKKKRVKKDAKGWLQPLAIGTLGGAAANQFPSFEEQQRLRANRKRRKAAKKGVAKRLEAPVWPEDESFNAQAAQAAYDLVMKMDDDTAETFVTMVVSNALETDIEKNQRTLQKHLDEVVAKRLADLKRATIRVVAKGGDAQEQIDFARAIAQVEEIIKVKNPYDLGYVFREDKIRRDPGSGQFQTKIKHTQKQPINTKVADSMGIVAHPVGDGKNRAQRFTPTQRAQYQDEYRQLANFLGTVGQSSDSPGNTRINLHFEDKYGNQWTERAASTRPQPSMLDPRDRTLKGVSAMPESLNVGGAAFGLAGALGGGMSPQRTAQVNAGAAQMPSFVNDWTQDFGSTDTNAKLYGRTAAAGQMLSQIGLPGSKTQLAGHFGNFVGSYGPQAEAVIGPPARRTAYRYRGTEKAPDAAMVHAYDKAVRAEMGQRGKTELSERAAKVAQNRALKAKTIEVAEATNTPIEAVKLTQDQRKEAINSARKTTTAMGTNPTWEEQQVGAAAIAEYLQRSKSRGGAAPKKGLYNLQLAAGNTPPSEGVILDRDGQIVAQAIGYGDDHYLPFNLKNLKGLKGGSYIRNRSVGGLTSEDIYTGLVSGARSVTVVSRSGTFTMEFEPDFRGGRRHNDKAMRMTRRYEQLLDAVQSEQVERQGIDPEMREVIRQKVKEKAAQFPGAYPNKVIREEIKRKEEEYKASPELDDTFDEYIHMIVNNRSVGLANPDRQDIETSVRNQHAAEKEYRFRLNGSGYSAALDALQEQFPYYIKTRYVPTKEEGRHEIEPDRGYVEPGRLRPTAAAAGLFGGVQGPSYDRMGGKKSAAEANYAKPAQFAVGRQTPATTPPPAAAQAAAPAAAPVGNQGTVPAGAVPGQAPTATPAAAPVSAPVSLSPAEQATYQSKATELQQAIQTHVDLDGDPDAAPWYNLSAPDFRAFLQVKDNLANFDHYVTTKRPLMLAQRDRELRPLFAGYTQASGRLGQKPYERILGEQWLDKPYAFPADGPAYQAGADAAIRHQELERIGAGVPGIVNVKPLAQMTDRELEQEVLAVSQVRRELTGLDDPTMDQRTRAMENAMKGVNTGSPSMSVFASTERMDDYLETVHRTRVINLGVADAERDQQVKNTTPPAEENGANEAEEPSVEERRDEMARVAGQVMAGLPQDSNEYQLLNRLKIDLEKNRDRIRSSEALSGVRDIHADAYTLITQAYHEGKVPKNYQAKGKLKALNPPGDGGSILS